MVALFCSDVGVVALGSSINDRACRDAARAAAQGSTYAQAVSLAQAALLSHKADGYFVTTPALDVANFTYQDFGGNAPPDTSPYVTVTTSNSVRVPIPVSFFGAKFGASGALSFTKTYTFPIVKTTLYLN